MRIEGINSEHYFKALYYWDREKISGKPETQKEFLLSEGYFKNKEDALMAFEAIKGNAEVKLIWPVEIDPNGYCIVPDAVE